MAKQDCPIGVFDSGLGGISVLRELQQRMPQESFLYYGDSAFAPYGVKTKEEITKRCFEIVEELLAEEIKAIVIACNTATSACVNELRSAYPQLIIIGMEPALKLAVHQKTKQSVVVMATDFTLREQKFEDLMTQYAKEHHIYKQPCPRLVEIVEQDQLEDQQLVLQQLHSYLDPYLEKHVDSIVLGCTHFVFYKKLIQAIAEDVLLIDGNEGTARHLEELLMSQGLLQLKEDTGVVRFWNSTKDEQHLALSAKLFHQG